MLCSLQDKAGGARYGLQEEDRQFPGVCRCLDIRIRFTVRDVYQYGRVREEDNTAFYVMALEGRCGAQIYIRVCFTLPPRSAIISVFHNSALSYALLPLTLRR